MEENTLKEDSGIERLLSQVHQDEDVLAVFLFGSSAREEKNDLSDIDLCFVLVPGQKPFEPFELFNKRLDYLKNFNFDIQIFQQLPLYIRQRILKEGKLLFVRDEANLYELAYRTAQAFEDFKPLYLKYLEEIKIARP